MFLEYQDPARTKSQGLKLKRINVTHIQGPYVFFRYMIRNEPKLLEEISP